MDLWRIFKGNWKPRSHAATKGKREARREGEVAELRMASPRGNKTKKKQRSEQGSHIRSEISEANKETERREGQISDLRLQI